MKCASKINWSKVLRFLFFLAVTTNCVIILVIFNQKIYKYSLSLRDAFDDIDESSKLLDMNDFKYLISKPKCDEADTSIVFVTLVHSGPTHFERRTACRKTWAHSNSRTITYFVMGAAHSLSLQKQIEEENAIHNDIIQGNFMDSYHNLTYKHTMVLKWFGDNCAHVKYLFKCDDDVYINTPAVLEYLSAHDTDSEFLMGFYRTPEKCKREGKWLMTREEYAQDYFPEYVYGPAAIYTNNFVLNAYKKTATTRFLWIDDVFISGFIRMQLNVKIIPIYDYLLYPDQVNGFMNGSMPLPDPGFMVAGDTIREEQMLWLWELTEPYRAKYQSERTNKNKKPNGFDQLNLTSYL